MKILEKNPQKGGIPAIEKRAKSKIFVKVLELPKLLNEYKVLKSKLINWKIVVNNIKMEMLYINIYDHSNSTTLLKSFNQSIIILN